MTARFDHRTLAVISPYLYIFISPATMALPFVKTFADCANFEKTVLAYLPQLYDLPQQISQSATSWQQLQTLYLSTNPLIFALAVSLFLAPIFLVVSEINKNYSQVDRCWSILPTIYNAHYMLYAHATGVPARRLDTLLAVSLIWSVRRASIVIYSIADFDRGA